MDDSMRSEDRGPVSNALAAWWKSQGIAPHHAAHIMAGMAGGIVGGMIADDEKMLKEGVDLLVKEMRRAACAAFDGERK